MPNESEPVAEKDTAPVIVQGPEPATELPPTLVIEPDLELVIKQIKRRIREHQSLLSRNRKRTELALVHPIPEFMDWDTSDPELVIPAYRGEDYALVRNSRPKAILAARKLHSNYNWTKKLEYCESNMILYLINTDGDHWQIHSVLSPKREFPKVYITKQPTPEAATNLYRIFDAIDGNIAR